MTATYYMRLEGANLSHFIEDTQDLSTIRGAGLLLLDAVKFAESALGASLVATLSEGASVGLFEVRTDEPESLRKQLLNALQTHSQFRHITFLVDFAEASGGFGERLEQLVTSNRRRQLREPSLVLPEWNESSTVPPDEAFDRMLPAPKRVYVPDDVTGGTKLVDASEVTKTRRDHGRKQRRRLYSALGVSADDAFTEDLRTLSEGDRYGLCRNKIALFYADGNKFGKIQRENCKSAIDLLHFDKRLRNYRTQLLSKLIRSTEGDLRWWNHNEEGEHVRRLETLLWGGDELIWVIPAWLGWEVAQFFFMQTKSYTFSDTDGPPLTHAAGLVFASAKAPIQRVKRLAQNLAQVAKNAMRDKAPCNLLAYEALESFDFASEGVAEQWRRRLAGSSLEPTDLLLPGEQLQTFGEDMRALATRDFPIRQLHEQTRAALKGTPWEKTLGDPNVAEFQRELRSLAASAGFQNSSPKASATWLHLAQLWNYVAKTPVKPAGF